MKYTLLIFLLLISCKPSLPEDNSNITSECDAPFGYDCRDINVLKSFIKINSQIGNYMDYNNNGVIDPLEFGYQAWDENGRLVTLDLNYSPNIIMKEDNPSEIDPANYRLDSIPVEIGRLTNLENCSNDARILILYVL